MQDIASWIFLLLSIYCCHISFPVLSLFPSPSSIFGWFGVSLLRITTMTMRRCRWVFLPGCYYTVLPFCRQMVDEACSCLTLGATLFQTCCNLDWGRLRAMQVWLYVNQEGQEELQTNGIQRKTSVSLMLLFSFLSWGLSGIRDCNCVLL